MKYYYSSKKRSKNKRLKFVVGAVYLTFALSIVGLPYLVIAVNA